MKYRSEIDGLRAIAVLAVMLFHAGMNRFAGGYVGVDIFFVISGYLITTIILNEMEQGRFSLAHFYERRIRRILPALFAVLFACLPLAWVFLIPSDFKSFSHSIISTITFSSNILFWRQSGYFDTAAELKPLLHTWSLAVEEQYYIFFPLFMMLMWRFGKKLILPLLGLGFIISLSLAQWGAENAPSAAFYLLPTRIWEILVGAFCAFYLHKHPSIRLNSRVKELCSAAGLAMIFAAILIYDKNTPAPGAYMLLPTLGTAFIILFAADTVFVKRALSLRPLVFAGLLSYSAYLWHQPIFAFTRHAATDHPSYLEYVGLIIVSFVLAYISWRFIEQPFRKKDKIPFKDVIRYTTFCAALLLAVAVWGSYSQGFPNRPHIKKFETLHYDTSRLGYVPCDEELKKSDPLLTYCHQARLGPADAAIIGDSHADDKFYGIAKHIPDKNWALLGNASCPPLMGTHVEADVKGCSERFAHIFAYLENTPSIKTVILSFIHGYTAETNFAADHVQMNVDRSSIIINDQTAPNASRNDAFYNGLERAVSFLSAQGKEVIIVIDIPELPYFPTDCLRTRKSCTHPRATVLERQAAHREYLSRLAQRHPNIKIFDPIDMFCNDTTCDFQSEQKSFYRDSHHLSLTGSDIYGTYFSQWRQSYEK